MKDNLLPELKRTFEKCSDGQLHEEYRTLLNSLFEVSLNQELVDFLCDKATSKKHFWEIRLDHLRVLLLNASAKAFDLKHFYFENLKKSRRLAMKFFYIRGYAIYASEEELNSVMENFRKNLERNHDYIDYNCILSVAGLPYLVNTYGYNCFVQTLEKAKEEHEKIDSLLHGFFTLDEKLNQVNLLSFEEVCDRERLFHEKGRKMLEERKGGM